MDHKWPKTGTFYPVCPKVPAKGSLHSLSANTVQGAELGVWGTSKTIRYPCLQELRSRPNSTGVKHQHDVWHVVPAQQAFADWMRCACAVEMKSTQNRDGEMSLWRSAQFHYTEEIRSNGQEVIELNLELF